jgi:hypothetical protein
MERERQRLVARKIKYARGKVRNGSTTMVTVEDSQGGLTEYCKKQDIEREILQNNKKKNKAIPPSPLYKKPLTQNFGFK